MYEKEAVFWAWYYSKPSKKSLKKKKQSQQFTRQGSSINSAA